MKRRCALPVFAAVSLAALTGLGLAQPTGAPGTIATVAGTGQAGSSGDSGPAAQARLNGPAGITVDAAGALFIGDNYNGRVRRVSPEGIISTVAARLTNPQLIALDQAGNVFINERGANRVRKLSPAGVLTTVAGNGRSGFSGDGGPATEARIQGPGGVAVDAAGNLYIADHNNHRIRKVSPDGIITTVAGSGPTGRGNDASTGDGGLATEARLHGPLGLALDRSGNLFFTEIGDFFGTNRGYRVRKVDTNGVISTVAGSDKRGFTGDGGPATAARLNTPGGVAVDSAGNLFFTDQGNLRVRKVDANGIISTVAGGGTKGYVDGALATAMRLQGPINLAVDADGNLLIGDFDGQRVLKLFGVAAPGLIAGEPFPSP